MRILIIDDEADFCLIFKKILETRGHEVVTAGNISEGVESIEAQSPDVIFIDNYLPDGKGWTASATIKKRYPGIHINLISAQDRSFFTIDKFEDFVWEKPITVEQIDNYFRFIKV